MRAFLRTMTTGAATLQFVWISGHKREQPRYQDYFIEVVERLTAITPEIDQRVANVFRRSDTEPSQPTSEQPERPESS
jgi:hypothetical protein